jgi:hypothetical protein
VKFSRQFDRQFEVAHQRTAHDARLRAGSQPTAHKRNLARGGRLLVSSLSVQNLLPRVYAAVRRTVVRLCRGTTDGAIVAIVRCETWPRSPNRCPIRC